MEAVPKLPFISFELKTSPESTRFGPKLKRYISDAYREDPESYNNELHQLEGLRSAAVRPTVDSAGLSALIRYFCQLRSLQSRFPMAKGQPAACSFSWKDIYASMSCSLADVRFEMACILYNIGALHTQIAESEPRTTADSLKAACTHYQNAAWAFEHLMEQYPQPPGVDVSTDIMRLLQEICFAQAQECILDKSIQDTRKPSVVGAVATQVVYFYKNALALLGPSTGTDNIHEIVGSRLYNYWHRNLSFRVNYIGCIVCLYQGMHAEEQQKMGERVAFYQQAVDKLGEARKLAKYVEPPQIAQEALTFTNDVVEGKRKAAKNENEFIYHEEVPEKDLLVGLKPVCLVKAIPINFNDPEVTGPDIFSRLVPMGAHEAASMYSEEKAKLLRQIVSQVDDKSSELEDFMSSLQLDQLDILDSEQKIPQEIVDRCAAMNAKTEVIQTLVDSMNNLAEIISDVEHSLSEINTLIQEEIKKEKEYQKTMGPRPPSIVQTELSREYHKYLEAHTRTNESNQVLHKAMTLHIANLRLLAQPLDVLEAKIPSIDNIEGLDRETMAEMRRVVRKAGEMQAQRAALLQQLRTALADDDVTAKLLARTTETSEQIFKQEIEKHTPLVKIIEQNLSAQENILNALTSLYASYGESRRALTDVLRKRDGLINALVTSYDTYEELLGKSQKGQEFYKKMLHNVSTLLSRLRATCQVQEEERAQLLAKQSSKSASVPAASVPATSVPATSVPIASVPATSVPDIGSGAAPRKLKDYLPYMKNRSSRTYPQAQVDTMPQDTYYPESIYPTSVRPTPVGSEAADLPQMQMPDGVVMPQGMVNPYDRYGSSHAPSETEHYSVPPNYAYPATSKAYDKPETSDINYGYTAYTPAQYASQVADPQQQVYANPYYSSTHNNSTIVTDSQITPQYGANVNPVAHNQFNTYTDPYSHQSQVAGPIPDAVSTMSAYSAGNQTDLNASFAQMHVTPKQEAHYGQDYSQTYFSVKYPQTTTPNIPNNYTNAAQNSVNSVQSQLSSDYSSLNYPYSDVTQYGQANQTSYASGAQYPTQYNTSTYANVSSSGYATYTSADSSVTSTTSIANNAVTSQYQEPEPQAYNPPMSQLNVLDQPIKSHVTGEALSTPIFHQNYQYPTSSYSNPNEPTATYSYPDQTSVNYSQTYENHPGYTYNNATGTYEYNYGSQNSFNVQGNVSDQSMQKDPNLPVHGVYTSAGSYGTVQSPSETPQASIEQPSNNQTYYNNPYGYIAANQPNVVTNPVPDMTNYGANMNQSTYMQSGQGHDTNNQATTPKEEVNQPTITQTTDYSDQNQPSQDSGYQNQTIEYSKQNTYINQAYLSNQANIANQEVPTVADQASYDNETPSVSNQEPIVPDTKQEPVTPVEPKTEPKPIESEPSVFDLLSEIDFSVEQRPLMPEIKVPQVSESAVIRKPVTVPKTELIMAPVPKEEVLKRPAKRDLFSDPSLLNKFTQEVKMLQKLVDSLTNRTPSGLTVLDSKWKSFQDGQTKENMTRSKTIAMQHCNGNIVTEIVPYDDSRLTLKSDPDAYINASYYKQLASWCIPLVIAKNPLENEYSTFWKAILENKISCVVCLLGEIEMQGTTYWPTAKGQSLELDGVKVVLEEVRHAVNWTERRLRVSGGGATLAVQHYQLHVFPAKVVCSPLVLLADAVLRGGAGGGGAGGGEGAGGACVQCARGGGRGAVLALLLMLMCEVRAGQLQLCDMLDAGCTNLYKHRSNILEDTKYLADAYRTALFYVQGVLCSGTTMFNGEAVSVKSGAGVLPPPPPAAPAAPADPQPTNKPKFSRESFEEMKQSPGLKSGDMKDPLNFLDPLWSLKKK